MHLKNFFSFSVLYERDVSRWKKDDSLFVETHNFPAILDQVRKQTHVTFVGVPGSGKTATVRHIALTLQKEGYQILPIKDIKDVETFCDPDNPQVFIIDDVLGVFGLDKAGFNKLKKYQDRIKDPAMSETKTLMTCREAVFKNDIVSKAFMSQEKHIVQFSDDANALTTEDRRKLLVKYNLEAYVLLVQKLPETSKMFPILCKLLSQREELRFYGSHFFRSPVLCILNEVEQMKTENKMQYVSLVLLMANQNELSEDDLENKNSDINIFSEIKYEILKKCKVKNTTDTFEFIDALTEMEGTYTKKCNNSFTFEHDSMLEIIAYNFGCQYPELILRVMSSDYIANYIEIDECTSRKESENTIEHVYDTFMVNTNTAFKRKSVNNLCIKLKEPYFPILCERLVRDIKIRGYRVVFMNKTLKHLPVLQLFISLMGADINMEQENETPLTAACKHGILIVVEELIKAGADVNLSNGNVTPLTAACERDHLPVIENLIKVGADVNLRDEVFTPLTLACKRGRLGIVEILIKAGADVNLCYQYKTPLTIACEQCHLDVVVVLIQTGANVNMCDGTNTPLTIACKEKRTNAVKKDMEIGIDFQVNFNSKIPQKASCKDSLKYYKTTYMSIRQYLIISGADVNLNDGYNTPLTTACLQGRIELVQELIKFGADVNLIDINHTPLITACYNGNLSIARVLIEASANVNLGNEYETPLTFACEKGYVSMVEELIKAGADVNIVKHCKTPLTSACANKQLDVVEKLIKMGANVNLSDGCYTPLTISCGRGYLRLVQELIKAGADLNLKIGNETALSSACGQGCWNVAEELVNAGVNIKYVPLLITCGEDKPIIVKKLIQEGAEVLFLNDEYEIPITKTYPGNTMYYHSTLFLEDQRTTAKHYEHEVIQILPRLDSLLNQLSREVKRYSRNQQLMTRYFK